MSLPSDTLSTTAHPAAMRPPDDTVLRTRLIDHERGGRGVSDPSAGLDVQNWTAEVVGSDVKLYPTSSPGSATTLFTLSGITRISLAFDQNMRPAIAYIAAGHAYLWWWDPVPNAATTMTLDHDVKCPTLTMDDKRHGAESYNDMLMFYTRGHQVLYRQQRDRFLVERLLHSFPGSQIYIRRAGMNRGRRMQIEVVGSDSYTTKLVTYASAWTAAIYDVSSTSFPAAMPASLTADTLLLAIVMTRSAVTPPAGWTLVTSQSCTDGTTTQILSVYRKNSVAPSDSSTNQTWGQASALRIGVSYVATRRSNGSTPSVLASSTTAVNSTSTMSVTPPALTATKYQELFILAATSIVGEAAVSQPTPPAHSSLRSGADGQTRLGVSVRARFARRQNAGAFTFPAAVAMNGLAAVTLRIGA